ncbi:MAG: phospholipase C, phosphocholine-specific [Bacteroidetes bacterium]|nr:phospholipase C, phosphocholine-specific [Bacteroidota bacterium]
MDTRREFIKKATLLSGGAGIFNALPASIQKALAIDPQPGSTYLDAEHVVLLMQENRSFDHTYGTLQGVRGFNDPRAIQLPDKNPVWLQTNAAGETYPPFRMDFKNSKATWMHSLPHSWTNQVDARNHGKFDKWLDVKQSGDKDYAAMPLTMGYYTRQDIPFYYALADAFTICDQHFCSSLTGTTPNRLFFWTGTIREKQNDSTYANVWNENVDYGSEVQWPSFPERLEENNISWKIYQNELSMPLGLSDEEDAWLGNFGDSPLQWFNQYNIRFTPGYISFLKKISESLPGEINLLEDQLRSIAPSSKESVELRNKLKEKMTMLNSAQEELKKYTPENYEKLSQFEKNLHEKAFTTNKKDPHYHEMTTLNYKDGDVEREVKIPKGDIFHQFREDVKTGNLPTVSWLVAPESFSDHPSSAWYGAWYVSEALDILTQNPEVWKKTIFILTYDENDGYFDHVPPFVAPDPRRAETGSTSKGVDSSVDFVSFEQQMLKKAYSASAARESAIGLGYRVPMVVASPWSRGGWVNSQVFDHTSCLQFLEKFLTHKTGKKVEETNISSWRRTVCGDLSSVFRPYRGEKINYPEFLSKDLFIESVHKAKFKDVPNNYRRLSKTDIDLVKERKPVDWMPKQEKGIRASCALPYQLDVDGRLSTDKKNFGIKLEVKNEIFEKESAGSPFNVYAPGNFLSPNKDKDGKALFEAVRTWAYAVSPGDALTDSWPLDHFENEMYHLRVYGPNGFFREFKGNANDPLINIFCINHRDGKNKLTGNIEVQLFNEDNPTRYNVEIEDNSYKSGTRTQILNNSGSSGSHASIVIDLNKSYGWYDFTVRVTGNKVFEKRYAGRVEIGKASYSDPAMAG